MGNETSNFVMTENSFDQTYNNPLMNSKFCMKRSSCDNNMLSHMTAKQNLLCSLTSEAYKTWK